MITKSVITIIYNNNKNNNKNNKNNNNPHQKNHYKGIQEHKDW